MLQQPTCAYCGKILPFSKHTGRRRRFCSPACRKSEFRYQKTTRPQCIGCDETRSKNSTNSSTSTGVFRGRGIDLCGIEPAVRERIIDLEFAGWKWAHPHEDGGSS